jgi:DNA polymerase-1
LGAQSFLWEDVREIKLTSHQQISTAFRRLGVPILTEAEAEKVEFFRKNKGAGDPALKKVFGKSDLPLSLFKKLIDGADYSTSTNAKKLKPLQKDYPVLTALDDFRHVDKMKTSYGENFLDHLVLEDGVWKIYPSFFQIGAPTGRMACKNPNVQQMSDKPIHVAGTDYEIGFREAFDFEEGYVGIDCDFSQIELRVLAEMSCDPGFMEAFLQNKDLHSDTAAKLFKVKYEDVHCETFADGTSNPNYKDYQKRFRKPAKNINFAIPYGTSAYGLSSMPGAAPLEESDAQLKLYAKTYPVLWDFLNSQGKSAQQKMEAVTAWGRIQRFTRPKHPFDSKEYRSEMSLIGRNGRNMPIQGTAADIFKRALVLVHRGIQGYDAQIINMVHDEVVVKAKKEQAEEVRRIVQEKMEEAEREFLKKIPASADAKIVSNWGQK